MCTAMLDPSLVFESFFKGADGVLISGCHEQDCHYDTGFLKAKTRYESIKEILVESGINEKRVKIVSISAGEGEKFAKVVSDFKLELEKFVPIKPGEYQRPMQSEKQTKKKSSVG